MDVNFEDGRSSIVIREVSGALANDVWNEIDRKYECQVGSQIAFSRQGATTHDNDTKSVPILLYGSWNQTPLLLNRIREIENNVLCIQVDQDENCVEFCVTGLLCPSELPTLCMAVYSKEGTISLRYTNSSYHHVMRMGKTELTSVLESTLSFTDKLEASKGVSNVSDMDTKWIKAKKGEIVASKDTSSALRIFVSGDRSQVGKSSVCLGLLGSLIRSGYLPSSLAYIKPATQCEATQPVAKYCLSHGIDHVPVGPVVYYKGFTREFLLGNTLSSSELLQNAKEAVDTISVGKEIVLIDGVGYPAVGSICGTCNAAMAKICGAKVLLVGKSGVGDAVDSYNLNASYFQSRNVPVIGAIFNRLSLMEDSYYSLEKCRRAVSQYFEKFKKGDGRRHKESAFGFVPEVSKSFFADEEEDGSVESFVSIFSQHVDVSLILEAARAFRHGTDDFGPYHFPTALPPPPVKTTRVLLSRNAIEESARQEGAAGG